MTEPLLKTDRRRLHPADFARLAPALVTAFLAGWFEVKGIGMAVTAYLVFTLVWPVLNYSGLIRQKKQPWWGYIPPVFDIGIIVLLCYLTGALNSVMAAALISVVAVTATNLDTHQGLWTVLLAVSGYLVAGLLVWHGHAEKVNILQGGTAVSTVSLVVSVVIFTLSALLTYTVVRRLSLEKARLSRILWSEMQQARNMRQKLAASRSGIHGFEIAGFTEQAGRSGGECYTVIGIDDIDWLVIGDVSDVGMPAGLVMMMVQTALTTALEQNALAEPADVLDLVNRVLYDNISKLKERRYTTITVFGAWHDGRFTFSGRHLSFFVFRKESGQVESVDAGGVWASATGESIDTDMDGVSLEQGDTVLVYTDGLTEATHKTSHSFYSGSKLKHIFAANGLSGLDDIRQKIHDSLAEYDCADEVTCVLLRRVVD